MDGFMDKLAQKFGTQDVIRANSEAEAKELEASRATVKEYENILSEVKRLNLKNVETNEMTAQLVQASLEKLDQYQAQPAGEAKDNTEILEALKEQGEFIHKENVRVYRNVQVSIVDELKLQTEALATQNADLKKQVKGVKSLAVTSLVFNIISTLCLIGSAIYVILTMVD